MPTRLRILVIGDSSDFGEPYTYLFEAKGYQLILTPKLAAAIDTILNDPPDLVLVITDLSNKVEKETLQTLKGGIYCTHIPFVVALPEKALSAGIDWSEYPVDDFILKPLDPDELASRVGLSLARMHRVFDNNPLTRLPGNTSILRNIQAVLDGGREMAIGYVDIDNFKPYNDRYGFSRGDEVIRMVAMLLTNTLREVEIARAFAGHVGGDDFTFTVPLAHVKDVCERIIKSFTLLSRNFIDREDLEKGFFTAKDRQGKEQRFPLLSLSISVVCNEKRRFRHYGAVAEAASQIKKKVKSMEGSNYLIDRRKK
ncbi:MAG: diguanylate cyclase [Pseudomonadota bacterium]